MKFEILNHLILSNRIFHSIPSANKGPYYAYHIWQNFHHLKEHEFHHTTPFSLNISKWVIQTHKSKVIVSSILPTPHVVFPSFATRFAACTVAFKCRSRRHHFFELIQNCLRGVFIIRIYSGESTYMFLCICNPGIPSLFTEDLLWFKYLFCVYIFAYIKDVPER